MLSDDIQNNSRKIWFYANLDYSTHASYIEFLLTTKFISLRSDVLNGS